MFARTESENRKLSSKTTPTWRRSDRSVTVAHVVPVDEDRSLGRVVEARDEHRQGRLAAAARPDDRHALTRGDVQIDAPRAPGRRRRSGSARSRTDVAAQLGELDGIGCVGDGGRQVEELEDALEPGPRLLADGQHAGELAGRRHQLGDVGREREEGAERDLVVERQPAAERQDRHLRERAGSPRGAAGSATAGAPLASASRTAPWPRRRRARARAAPGRTP